MPINAHDWVYRHLRTCIFTCTHVRMCVHTNMHAHTLYGCTARYHACERLAIYWCICRICPIWLHIYSSQLVLIIHPEINYLSISIIKFINTHYCVVELRSLQTILYHSTQRWKLCLTLQSVWLDPVDPSSGVLRSQRGGLQTADCRSPGSYPLCCVRLTDENCL